MARNVDLDVGALRREFAGELIGPADAGYDGARAIWNALVNKRPSLVARPTSAADVAAAVTFAREQELPVAVRCGGHSVAGLGTCDRGMVIDLSAMRAVRVDRDAATARAQAGALWSDLDRETQAFGLATTGAVVSTVGTAGLTLGGGLGWLMRRYGLSCDNLLSADVVTAGGECITADERQHSDLLWALRGGGGGIGVVTSIQYRLHHVGPVVLGGAVFYDLRRAPDVLQRYDEWCAHLSDDVTSMLAFLRAPPEPFVPPAFQGKPMVAIAICCAGTVDDGRRALQPLERLGPPDFDLLRPLPYTALQQMFDRSAPPGLFSSWKHHFLSSLSDPTVGAIIEGVSRTASPFSTIHVHHLGGAVARVKSGETAFYPRQAAYVVNAIAQWTDPAANATELQWIGDAGRALEPHATGDAYINFVDRDEADRVPAAYGENYTRLLHVRDRYDPDHVFRREAEAP